jgi:hypothetical protein
VTLSQRPILPSDRSSRVSRRIQPSACSNSRVAVIHGPFPVAGRVLSEHGDSGRASSFRFTRPCAVTRRVITWRTPARIRARSSFTSDIENIHHTVRYAELAAGTFKDIGGISPSQSGRRRRPESRRGVREKEAPFVMEGTVRPWPSESGPGSRHWPRMDWRSGLLISSVGVRRLVGN